MAIQILTIGKKHEPWVAEGIYRYEKRLNQPFNVEWALLPHSLREGNEARQEESRRILERIDRDKYVILLDERGKLYDSPALSQWIVQTLEQSRPIVFLIGGAYGVDESVHVRVDGIWSLSPLVFPHQLVRLLLVEQFYRAQEIASGRPYHHR